MVCCKSAMDRSRSSFCWLMKRKRSVSSSYSPMAARLTSPMRSRRPRRSSMSAAVRSRDGGFSRPGGKRLEIERHISRANWPRDAATRAVFRRAPTEFGCALPAGFRTSGLSSLMVSPISARRMEISGIFAGRPGAARPIIVARRGYCSSAARFAPEPRHFAGAAVENRRSAALPRGDFSAEISS